MMAETDLTLQLKQCSKCLGKKPIDAFRQAPHKNNPNYRRTACRECEKAESTRYNKTHRAQRRASSKAYAAHKKQERMLYMQAWRTVHKEEQSAYNKSWREEHKEERQLYMSIYNIEHREEIALRTHLYNITHRMQFARYQHNRRAKEKALPDTFSDEQEQFCRQYFNYACAVCDREESFDAVLCLDHWIPFSSQLCPGNIATNIVVLCHGNGGCNNKKGRKDPGQWVTEQFGTRKAAAILKKIEAYFAAVRARFPANDSNQQEAM